MALCPAVLCLVALCVAALSLGAGPALADHHEFTQLAGDVDRVDPNGDIWLVSNSIWTLGAKGDQDTDPASWYFAFGSRQVIRDPVLVKCSTVYDTCNHAQGNPVTPPNLQILGGVQAGDHVRFTVKGDSLGPNSANPGAIFFLSRLILERCVGGANGDCTLTWDVGP